MVSDALEQRCGGALVALVALLALSVFMWGKSAADPDLTFRYTFDGQVDDRNQLTLIKELDIDAGTTTRSDTPVYDAAGSLVFDGNYYFQYDAWNRLVQVNEATDMGQAGIVLGDLVKHYLYDGLGRLVRTQSLASGGSSVRTERFYYDGLRRIQEFVTEPLTPLAGINGDPTLEAMAEQTVSPQTNPDAQSAPTGFEQQQLGGGIGGGAPRGRHSL